MSKTDGAPEGWLPVTSSRILCTHCHEGTGAQLQAHAPLVFPRPRTVCFVNQVSRIRVRTLQVRPAAASRRRWMQICADQTNKSTGMRGSTWYARTCDIATICPSHFCRIASRSWPLPCSSTCCDTAVKHEASGQLMLHLYNIVAILVVNKLLCTSHYLREDWSNLTNRLQLHPSP